MSSGCCREITPDGPGVAPSGARVGVNAMRHPAVRRDYLGIAGLLFPGAILAFVPKCPVCLAAYIAIGTGLAISAPAAAYLRMTLIILCVASLSFFGARWLWLYRIAR
jgi:hypothetical protein